MSRTDLSRVPLSDLLLEVAARVERAAATPAAPTERRAHKADKAPFVSKCGLGRGQFEAMVVPLLTKHGPLTSAQVAAFLPIPRNARPEVSKGMHGLARKGIVARNEAKQWALIGGGS